MNEMKEKRVLVAAPTYSGKHYIFPTWYKLITSLGYDWLIVDNSRGLSYLSKLRREGYKKVVHLQRGKNSREAIGKSSEYIRQYAIDNNYDYIMMIETDLLPPKNVIEKLLAHNKDIIGLPYEIGIKGMTDNPRRLCIQQPYITNESSKLLELVGVNEGYSMLNGGVQRVGGMGVGCVLISKNIFEKYPFKYSERYNMHTDSIFYLDLMENNIPVYIDMDVLVRHENENWLHVKDR